MGVKGLTSQVRKLRLQQEIEKSRVLEDALHILAEQHNQLEQSLGECRSPRGMFDPDDDDEFFDCADDDAQAQSSSFAELFHSFNEAALNCSIPEHSIRCQTENECSNTNGNSSAQNRGTEDQSSHMCGDDRGVGMNNCGATKQFAAGPDFTTKSKWGGR
ncbi:hypothetical protein LSAT2_022238 [Lamellibrachia satsuma]|nr:hypothetical protein LSAT2_022238 [Lamellibrachia satsuma]